MKVAFPLTCRPGRYRQIHYRYVLASARAAGLTVVADRTLRAPESCRFEISVAGRKALVDFDNFPVVTARERTYAHVFKFHAPAVCPANVHPFPVVSFYHWAWYWSLQSKIRYRASGDRILCRQRPYGGASGRRIHVQKILGAAYGDDVETAIVPQAPYWEDVADCLTHVFVPGARNDMLDRGMAQWLAFGACVVAPPIQTALPFGGRLVPGEHFVQCRPDYSDLLERIEWCRANREACRAIGAWAKELFRTTCVPARAWQWVRLCLNG